MQLEISNLIIQIKRTTNMASPKTPTRHSSKRSRKSKTDPSHKSKKKSSAASSSKKKESNVNTGKAKSKAQKVKPFARLKAKISPRFKVDRFTQDFKKFHPSLKTKVNAVSLHPSASGYEVEIAVNKDEVSTMEKLLRENNVPSGKVRVVACNRLEFFDLAPMHAKMFESNIIITSGSCGPFMQNGSKTSVFSAAHVFRTKGADMAIAHPYSNTSMAGTVEHSIQKIDLGIATLENQVALNFEGSKIGKPKENESVKFYGGTSGMQEGQIRSLNATVTIDGIVFDNLIELVITSQHGDSGAAVLNSNNDIIGLIVGGDAQNRRIYCSNLFLNKSKIPSAFRQNLKLHSDVPISTGKEVRGLIKEPSQVPMRREVELWIHTGTLVKPATPEEYGEIKAASIGLHDQERMEDISVLTHFDHSFESEDGGESLRNKQVFFFAIPLEYLVEHNRLTGLKNSSPLVAINVTNVKKTLYPLNSLHKFQPCSTGTTVQADKVSTSLLAMAPVTYSEVYKEGHSSSEQKRLRRKRSNLAMKVAASTSTKRGKFVNYCINDYGQLVLVISDEHIKPWVKIIAVIDNVSLRSPVNSTKHILTKRLCFRGFDQDPNWEWRAE